MKMVSISCARNLKAVKSHCHYLFNNKQQTEQLAAEHSGVFPPGGGGDPKQS